MTLFSDAGSSICARLAPEIVTDLARGLLAAARRRAFGENSPEGAPPGG